MARFPEPGQEPGESRVEGEDSKNQEWRMPSSAPHSSEILSQSGHPRDPSFLNCEVQKWPRAQRCWGNQRKQCTRSAEHATRDALSAGQR